MHASRSAGGAPRIVSAKVASPHAHTHGTVLAWLSTKPDRGRCCDWSHSATWSKCSSAHAASTRPFEATVWSTKLVARTSGRSRAAHAGDHEKPPRRV